MNAFIAKKAKSTARHAERIVVLTLAVGGRDETLPVGSEPDTPVHEHFKDAAHHSLERRARDDGSVPAVLQWVVGLAPVSSPSVTSFYQQGRQGSQSALEDPRLARVFLVSRRRGSVRRTGPKRNKVIWVLQVRHTGKPLRGESVLEAQERRREDKWDATLRNGEGIEPRVVRIGLRVAEARVPLKTSILAPTLMAYN